MFASTRTKAAATVVLLALVLVPVPLLPPQGLAGKLQSVLGVGWKTAYLAATIGLHVVLYGSVGAVAAFAVGPARSSRQHLLQLVIVPLIVVGIAVVIRSLKLGHVPRLANAVMPIAACVLGVIFGLLFRQHGWRVTLSALVILALGIAIGHERLARFAGQERGSELVRGATALRSGTSLRGREDWARHYCLSAALTVVETPFMSDTGGLIKEELDALARGSGFSFGDLAADRAGVRFAQAATASDSAAQAMQARLRAAYSADDFFPAAGDLPENLTVEQFRRDFVGVGCKRYRLTLGEIEARLDRCLGLSSPSNQK